MATQRLKIGATIAAFVLFIGLNGFTSYRAEQERADRIDQVCNVVRHTQQAVADTQALNKTDPLVAPPGSPSFVTDILEHVNARGRTAAAIAIRDLNDARCG